MKKTLVLILALISSPVFSEGGAISPWLERWESMCPDSEDEAERAKAEFHINFSTVLQDSLTNKVIENWLYGRSLVSVNKTSDNHTKCVYTFTSTGKEVTPKMTNSISAEIRGYRSQTLNKKMNIIKWVQDKCTGSSKIEELMQRNYRLVSMFQKTSDQCSFVFVKNLDKVFRSK